MGLRITKKLKKLVPLLIALAFVIVFLIGNLYYLEPSPSLKVVVDSILKDGLPSLVSIIIVSVIIESTSRSRDRERIRDNFSTIFQKQVGFSKHVSGYDSIADGIENMVIDHHEFDIKHVKILLVGAEQVMIRGVINALRKTHNDSVKIDILLLDPTSELASHRGEAIKQQEYQMDIKSNLSSIVAYFTDADHESDNGFSKKNVSISLYKSANGISTPGVLPSVVMAKFGDEFISFSPLWNCKNVKNGPLCFVPKGNKMYDWLSREYDIVKDNSAEYEF